MDIVNFLIKKLAGYDILESEKKLKLSLEKAKKDIDVQKRENNSQKRNIAVLKDKICELEDEKRNNEELKSKTEELDKARKRIIEKEDEYVRLHNYTCSRQQEINRLNVVVEDLNAENKSNQDTIMNHVKKITDLTEEIERISSEKEVIKKQIEERDELIKDKDRVIETLSKQKEDDGKRLGEICNELESVKKEKDALSSQLEKIQSEKVDLLSEHNQLNNKITALEQELDESSALHANEIIELKNQLEETIKQKDQEIKLLDQKYNDACIQLNNLKKEKENLSTNNSDSLKSISDFKNEKQELNKNIHNLEDKIHLLTKSDELDINEDNKASESGDNEGMHIEEDSKEQNVDRDVKDDIMVEGNNYKSTESGEDACNNNPNENHEQGFELDDSSQDHNEERDTKDDMSIDENNSRSTKSEEDIDCDEKHEIIEDNSRDNHTDISTQELDNNDSVSDEHNFSSYVPRLTMESVWDVKNGKEINAYDFFNQPESEIINMRRTLQTAIIANKPVFVCPYCHQMVKISGKKTARGKASFFSHLYDSDACMIKTTTGISKDQIEASKYGLVSESERHIKLKNLIADALYSQKGKDGNISDIQIEKRVNGQLPYMRWRRPDVQAKYKQFNIVFELQLSTTFISTIVDRDLFYRLNNYYIIWVFNFDDNREYVNLSNLMCKDIYYANKRNVFIFDEKAQEESKKRGKLCLKCNWLDANNHWHYNNDNAIFVTLDDLMYDIDNKKPYYYDADLDYFKLYPELLNERKQREITREEIISALLRKEKEANDKYEGQSQESRDEAQREMLRTGKTGEVFKKNNKYGLSYNGTILIPAEYSSISDYNEHGYATIQMGRYYKGLIDKLGNIIVPCENTTEIVVLSDNSIIYRKGTVEWYMAGIKEPIAPFKRDKIVFKTIDERVNCIVISNGTKKYKDHYVYTIDNSIVLYQDCSSSVGKWIARKTSGEIVKEFNLEEMDFKEGKIFVNKKDSFCMKCGIIDYSFREIVPPIYEKIQMGYCYNGDYLVQKDWATYGVVSCDGKIKLECEYSQIEKEDNGYIVKKDGKFGFLNSYYYPIISIEYESISYIKSTDSFILDKSGAKGLFRKDSGFLLTCEYQDIRPDDERYIVKKDDTWAVFDKDGTLLTNKYYSYKIEKTSSKYIYIRDENNKMQLFDYDGTRHVRKQFYNIEETTNNLFVVDDSHTYNGYNSKGIANDDGEIIIPCNYYKIAPWGQHCFKVTIKKQMKVERSYGWGYEYHDYENYYLIDYNNQRVGVECYRHISELENGTAFAIRAPRGKGELDEYGHEIPIESESIILENGYIKQSVFSHWRVCDSTGTVIIPGLYVDIDIFVDGLFKAVNDDGKTILLNYKGEPKTKEYTSISVFSDSLFIVRDKEGMCCLIDYEGVEKSKKYRSIGSLVDGVAPADDTYLNNQGEECFQKVRALSNGFIIGKNHHKLGLYNKKGDIIIASEYDSIEPWGEDRLLIMKQVKRFNIYRSEVDDFCYIYDYDGKRITKRDYSSIGQLSNNKARAVCNGGQCMIDKDGNEWPIEMERMPDGNIICMKYNKYGVCDKNGNILVDVAYEEITFFCSNVYKVKYYKGIEEYFKLINPNNQDFLNHEYKYISSIEDGLFEARTPSGVRIYIDLKGNYHSTSEVELTSDITIKRMFDSLCVEKKGKVVADYGKYSDISLLGTKNIKAYSRVTGFHLFNIDFEEIILDNLCSELVLVDEVEQIMIKRGTQYGVINTDGKEIIPCSCYSLTYNKLINCYTAGYGGKYCLYKTDGNYFIDGKYDKIEINEDKTIKVSLGSKSWCYNSDANPIRNKKELGNGLYISEIRGLYGLVSKDDKIILEEEYDIIKIINTGIFKLFKNGHEGFAVVEDEEVKIKISCDNDCVTSFEGEMICIKGNEIIRTGIKCPSIIPFDMEIQKNDDRQGLLSKVGSVDVNMPNNILKSSSNNLSNYVRGRIVPVVVSCILWDKMKLEVRFADQIELNNGVILDVIVVVKLPYGLIFDIEGGGTNFIHRSMFNDEVFHKVRRGSSITVRKIGYDEIHQKDKWEVINVYS